MNIDEFVTQETIDWLLGPENPSVRFWTLQHLEGKSVENADVIDAQEAVMASSCIRTILGEQKEEGNWVKYNDMYNPKYTATTHTVYPANCLCLHSQNSCSNKY